MIGLERFIGDERNAERILPLLKTASVRWQQLIRIGAFIVIICGIAGIHLLFQNSHYASIFPDAAITTLGREMASVVVFMILVGVAIVLLIDIPTEYHRELSRYKHELDACKAIEIRCKQSIEAWQSSMQTYFVLSPQILQHASYMATRIENQLQSIAQLHEITDIYVWREQIAENMDNMQDRYEIHEHEKTVHEFLVWCKSYVFLRKQVSMIMMLSVALKPYNLVSQEVLTRADKTTKKFFLYEKGISHRSMHWPQRLSNRWDDFQAEIDCVTEDFLVESHTLLTSWSYA